MKKYQWASTQLQKKAGTYRWLMVGCMALVLFFLYLLPEGLRWLNFVPLAVAVVLWWQAGRVQARDRRLKELRKERGK